MKAIYVSDKKRRVLEIFLSLTFLVAQFIILACFSVGVVKSGVTSIGIMGALDMFFKITNLGVSTIIILIDIAISIFYFVVLGRIITAFVRTIAAFVKVCTTKDRKLSFGDNEEFDDNFYRMNQEFGASSFMVALFMVLSILFSTLSVNSNTVIFLCATAVMFVWIRFALMLIAKKELIRSAQDGVCCLLIIGAVASTMAICINGNLNNVIYNIFNSLTVLSISRITPRVLMSIIFSNFIKPIFYIILVIMLLKLLYELLVYVKYNDSSNRKIATSILICGCVAFAVAVIANGYSQGTVNMSLVVSVFKQYASMLLFFVAIRLLFVGKNFSEQEQLKNSIVDDEEESDEGDEQNDEDEAVEQTTVEVE